MSSIFCSELCRGEYFMELAKKFVSGLSVGIPPDVILWTLQLPTGLEIWIET